MHTGAGGGIGPAAEVQAACVAPIDGQAGGAPRQVAFIGGIVVCCPRCTSNVELRASQSLVATQEKGNCL